MGYKGYGLSEIWVPTVVQNSDGRIRPFYANTSVFDPADHLVFIAEVSEHAEEIASELASDDKSGFWEHRRTHLAFTVVAQTRAHIT